ncbi:hypothetical protein JTB14_008700 [Gonioctena quinquepunctata]|nr:hypothetical protein JTB14_008700 [Gonioctena quinquepunctata]
MCSTCVEGKGTRLPFKESERRTKNIGDSIHSDVCGPFNPVALICEFPEEDKESAHENEGEMRTSDSSSSSSDENGESFTYNEQESTVTTSGRTVKIPQNLQDYEIYTAYCLLTKVDQDPKTYKEASIMLDWQQAIDKELSSHEKLETWQPAKLPVGQRAIDTRWLFKTEEAGTKKARLVAKDLWTNQEKVHGKRISRYLNHTKGYGLQFKKGNMQELMALCDADWGGDQETRKSVSGFVCFHAGNPIVWHSRKQTCVAQSSMEAEYISAGIASRELVNLKGILSEFKVCESVVLKIDNLSAISLIKNFENSKRSKHIDIKYHFIKDLCLRK